MTAVSIFDYDSRSPRGPQLLRALFVVLSHSASAHRIWLHFALPGSADAHLDGSTFVLDPAEAKAELVDPHSDHDYIRVELASEHENTTTTPDVAVIRYDRRALFIQSYVRSDRGRHPKYPPAQKKPTRSPSTAQTATRITWSDLLTALAGFHNADPSQHDAYVAEFLTYCKRHFSELWSGSIAAATDQSGASRPRPEPSPEPSRWTRTWLLALLKSSRPTPVEVLVIAASLTLLFLPNRLGRPISFGLSLATGLLGVINAVRAWRRRVALKRFGTSGTPAPRRPPAKPGFVIPGFISLLTLAVLGKAFDTDTASTSGLDVVLMFAAMTYAGALAWSAVRWHWRNRVLVEISLAESAFTVRWPVAFVQARLREAGHASVVAASRTTAAMATVVATTAVIFHPNPPPPDLTGTWAISQLTPDHSRPLRIHNPNAPVGAQTWVITRQSNCLSSCLYYASRAAESLVILRPEGKQSWTGTRTSEGDCIQALPSNQVLQTNAYTITQVYTFTLTSDHHARLAEDFFGQPSSAAAAKGCNESDYATYEGTASSTGR